MMREISEGARSRKRRSGKLVWIVLVLVLALRLAFPPPAEESPEVPEWVTDDWRERDPRFQREGAREGDFGRGGMRPFEGGQAGGFERGPGGNFGDGRRFRRPPTRVNPPVGPVPPDLWRLHIEIGPAEVEQLRGYVWRGWRGASVERPEVKVTVREGGVVYTNVALRPKGSAGSFRPFDDKPALTLNFSKHAPNQAFHGFKQLSLNNSVQDPSFLSEIISRELFQAAGVPVPRADHVTVLINDRDLGLYVLTEGWGKPFLRRHFQDVSGNLYDGGFVQDVDKELDTNSGDHREDRSDLSRLREAVWESDPALRSKRLAEVLDVDRFLSFVALEVMTCHWDGYALNRNNYRLFHDVATDRMVFMPHGLDQMFGVMRSYPGITIYPSMRGLVAQAVMATPGVDEAYRQRIATLRSTVFLEEKMVRRVQELSGRIRPTLAAYGPDIAEEHDGHVAYLIQRINERARSLTEQLAPAPADAPRQGE